MTDLQSPKVLKSLAVPSLPITIFVGYIILERMNSPFIQQFKEMGMLMMTLSGALGTMFIYLALKNDVSNVMS